MESIFYGGAIQGNLKEERTARAPLHRRAIEVIKEEGFQVLSEHVAGRDRPETRLLLEQSIGKAPEGIDWSTFIREKMLQLIDADISGTIFEVSVPSIGTGIEFHHACTRLQRGLSAIPILALYEKSYWVHGLTTMIKGIDKNKFPNFQLIEYASQDEFEQGIRIFLQSLQSDTPDYNSSVIITP